MLKIVGMEFVLSVNFIANGFCSNEHQCDKINGVSLFCLHFHINFIIRTCLIENRNIVDYSNAPLLNSLFLSQPLYIGIEVISPFPSKSVSLSLTIQESFDTKKMFWGRTSPLLLTNQRTLSRAVLLKILWLYSVA